MKLSAVLAALVLAIATLGAHAGPPPAGISGEVLEALPVEGYTYLRLKTKEGEVWAAVPTTAKKKGDQVTIVNSMVMQNFESRTLKRKFDKIVFGSLATTAAGAGPVAAPQAAPTPQPAALPPAKVSKATGPDARTVAEVVQGRTALKDKPVQVRGRVVKVNLGIMGKNWVHLRDGSGKSEDGSNDVLVTTTATTSVGSTVTAVGTVRTNKDFGSGYSYKVMLEDASFKP
jgi:hypothetical protein